MAWKTSRVRIPSGPPKVSMHLQTTAASQKRPFQVQIPDSGGMNCPPHEKLRLPLALSTPIEKPMDEREQSGIWHLGRIRTSPERCGSASVRLEIGSSPVGESKGVDSARVE